MTLAFSCPLAPLRRAVERAGTTKVVERRNTVPILGNVALAVEADGSLTVTGTDLDIWATASEPAGTAEVKSPGATTMPAGLLLDILKKASGDIAIEDKGVGRAILKTGRSRFTLNTLPVEDLPAAPVDEAGAARFDVSPAILKRIDDAVAFAISTEETRYYLNGIYLHIASAGPTPVLTAVATDGHRLSRLALPSIAVEGDMPGIIIPRKTVGLFTLIGAAAEAAIAVTVTARRITFEASGLRIVSKLIDGTFPDYLRVIPQNNSDIAETAREALAKAIDRVSAISSERGRAIRCVFGENDELTLAVTSPDAGSAEDAVAATGSFDPIAIGFNARYLADILATFPGDSIRFALADPGSPTVITDPADEDRLVVLMPMRV
ncbi:DNA polymerase III subunit beta [Aureimonas sp. SA4125]|uniref:DNA polymerase III subunit beta n=1 Tax=Aureimonas sp. SA4125 TaxID=2826993 RepID=UPI001CC68469|nr:DNA polymerase III subunit beta [Aureimonas sp. SA4125]BDA85007.1 DNA polymerase III subunit beta [Aureimonas sp. SA4125]